MRKHTLYKCCRKLLGIYLHIISIIMVISNFILVCCKHAFCNQSLLKLSTCMSHSFPITFQFKTCVLFQKICPYFKIWRIFQNHYSVLDLFHKDQPEDFPSHFRQYNYAAINRLWICALDILEAKKESTIKLIQRAGFHLQENVKGVSLFRRQVGNIDYYYY